MKLPATAKLFGFDSFQGLPSDWYYGCPKATFNVDGSIPKLGFPNVSFVKGWFEETLPKFLKLTQLGQYEQLIIHLDADLYEPTMFVLQQLEPFMRKGTIIIFDEFWFVKDEYRAFAEYSMNKKFICIAITQRNVAYMLDD
jgi:O-methyltransferase